MLQPTNSINLYAGETRTIEFSVADLAGRIQDLTGCRLVLTVREDLRDPTPLFMKSTSDPTQGLITNYANGLVTFFFVPQDTQSLRAAQYFYDIWVLLPNGERYIVVQPAVFEVKGTATRF
jgi:hypothetical protein